MAKRQNDREGAGDTLPTLKLAENQPALVGQAFGCAVGQGRQALELVKPRLTSPRATKIMQACSSRAAARQRQDG
jgi:hypothetical protein